MPTYDYVCDECGHEYEIYESIMSEPRKRLPTECKGTSLRRKIGPRCVTILFKGSGFYQTDYRSESYKKAAKADKPASEGPASKPSGSQFTSVSLVAHAVHWRSGTSAAVEARVREPIEPSPP